VNDLEHELRDRLKGSRLPAAPDHLVRAVGVIAATPRARDRHVAGWLRVLAVAGIVAGVSVLVVNVGAPAPSAPSTMPGAAGSPQQTAVATPTRVGLNTDVLDLALSGLDAPTATKYVEAAATDTWVITTLGSDRAAPVAVERYGDNKTGVAVLIYDYSASKTLRVGFGLSGEGIVERSVTTEQPGFSPREIARAKELVAASGNVREKVAGAAYVIRSVTGARPSAFDGRRVLAVILALDNPEGRLLIAYADLSSDAVVEIDDSTN
jgi:hypothetical protein